MSLISIAQQAPPRPGTYWSLNTGQLVRVGKEGALPGPAGRRWLRIPAALLLLLGPIAGLVFVMFLPVIGIVMIGYLIGQAVWQGTFGRAKDAEPIVQKETLPDAE